MPFCSRRPASPTSTGSGHGRRQWSDARRRASRRKAAGSRRRRPKASRPRRPPPALNFNNQTLRQIVRVSIGGERLRVVLSNAFGTAPLPVGAAHVALRDKERRDRPDVRSPAHLQRRRLDGHSAGCRDDQRSRGPDGAPLGGSHGGPSTCQETPPPGPPRSRCTTSGCRPTMCHRPGTTPGAADMPVMRTTLSLVLPGARRGRRAPADGRAGGLRRFDHRRHPLDARHEQPLAESLRQAADGAEHQDGRAQLSASPATVC